MVDIPPSVGTNVTVKFTFPRLLALYEHVLATFITATRFLQLGIILLFALKVNLPLVLGVAVIDFAVR